MNLFGILRFAQEEAGAITVDWTVMTASLVGMGLGVTGVVTDGVETVSEDIKCELQGIRVQASFGQDLHSYDFGGCIEGVSNTGNGVFAYSGLEGSDGAAGFLHYYDSGGLDMALLEGVTGDQSELYASDMEWHLKMLSGVGEDGIGETHPDVVIAGANGTTMTYSTGQVAGSDWTEFNASVSAESGWLVDGRDATESEMRAILADVESASIRTEQTSRDTQEEVGLDGVRFKDT